MFYTIFSWHNMGALCADFQANLSWKCPQIMSTEDCAKHCPKNEWTLEEFYASDVCFGKKC